MATKLSAPVKRDTGLTIGDNGVDRRIEVILRLDSNNQPVIAFHLKGLKSENVVSVQDAFELASKGSDEFQKLERAFKFRTSNDVKDGGKTAPLNITVYPDDTILVRHGAQGNAVSLSAMSLYHKAVVKDANLVMPKARKK